MELLGDFGGFNDGIVIIPAIFMQIYSQKMYLQSLFGLLPVKRRKNSDSRDKLKEKCSQGQSPFSLAESDI